MELISMLQSQLGMEEGQAQGAAGMVLKLAKDKLGGDFSALSSVIPQADGLVEQAPESSGALGAMGGLLGKLGGSAGSLGAVAQLASGFDKLGLDKGMVGKVVTVVMQYLQQQQGGDQLKALLEKVVR